MTWQHRPDEASAASANDSSADQALAWPQDSVLLETLGSWVSQRRWFPLKGSSAPRRGTLSVELDVDLAPRVRELVLRVPRGDDPEVSNLVHVPLVLEAPHELERFAVPGEPPGAEGVVLPDGSAALVDGAHHPAFWRSWAREALSAGTVLGAEGAAAIAQRAEHLQVMTGEQSNTSVVIPAPAHDAEAHKSAVGDLIVKLFRILAEGRNPDVEISVALTSDGWDRVRRPVAWSTLTWTEATTGRELSSDSAVASTFVPRARDGFELFCDLARTDDVTGPVRDSALALARDLGVTTAQMHAHLATALGTSRGQSPASLAQALRERAAWAMAEVPELAEQVPGLTRHVETALSRLEGLEHLEAASRVHGDYHLGQTLHEVGGEGRWYVLDFEGEPLRPLAQRREPDQPLRDVAGMLRSFDYASAVGQAQDLTWLPDVRAAFLEGYRRTRSAEVQQAWGSQVLLDALELDKALYEAVYEARNRPTWIPIPVRGLRMILERVSDVPS